MNPFNKSRDTFCLCSGAASEMEQLRRLLSSSVSETRADATRMLHSTSIDNGNGMIVATMPTPERYTGATFSLRDRMFSTSNAEEIAMLPSRRRRKGLGLPTSIKSLAAARRSSSGGGFPMPRLHEKVPNPFEQNLLIPATSKKTMFASVQMALKLARGESLGDGLFEIDDESQPLNPKFSSFPMPKMEKAFVRSTAMKSRKRKPYSFKSFEQHWLATHIQMSSSSSLFGNRSEDDWNMTRELFLRKAFRRNLQQRGKKG